MKLAPERPSRRSQIAGESLPAPRRGARLPNRFGRDVTGHAVTNSPGDQGGRAPCHPPGRSIEARLPRQEGARTGRPSTGGASREALRRPRAVDCRAGVGSRNRAARRSSWDSFVARFRKVGRDRRGRAAPSRWWAGSLVASSARAAVVVASPRCLGSWGPARQALPWRPSGARATAPCARARPSPLPNRTRPPLRLPQPTIPRRAAPIDPSERRGSIKRCLSLACTAPMSRSRRAAS